MRIAIWLLSTALLAAPALASAEWRIQPETRYFYTDDVALFSATRRTVRDEDPTQPIIDFDLADEGSDFVFEPILRIDKSFTLFGEEAYVHVVGQGFLFGSNSRFNHGSAAFEMTRDFGERTELRFSYVAIPRLFLGYNEVRFPETEGEESPELVADERLDSHFWVMAGRYRFLEGVAGVLFSRFGIRRYDEPFEQRNTNLFTFGVHAELEPFERVKAVLGFHYERGLADGRSGAKRQLNDDISYHNYFVTGEAEVELWGGIGMEVALHYERNEFTSNIPDDERRGEHENLFKGDIKFVYELTEIVSVGAGFQGVYRKESFEDSLRNLNAWFGVRATF